MYNLCPLQRDPDHTTQASAVCSTRSTMRKLRDNPDQTAHSQRSLFGTPDNTFVTYAESKQSAHNNFTSASDNLKVFIYHSRYAFLPFRN